MGNHQHVSELDLAILKMPVPKGAQLQDECPRCGGLAWKGLYFNNNNMHQARLQCLRTDCGHKFQRFSFRKAHPDGYKKMKGKEPEEYVDLVKVCYSCGCSDAKFYGVNNKDVHQARYKCLNSACKKLFTPFSKPRAHKRTTAADLQADDDDEFFERSIMNNTLQYPTTFDPQCSTSKDSVVTQVVDPTILVPCAHNAFQNSIEEEERARLTTSLIDPHHNESRNSTWPTGNLQQDDPVNALPTPATWSMQSEDHGVTTLMPTPTTKLQEVRISKGHAPTVGAPNPSPTTLQEEDQLVHDASITLKSLHEDQEQGYSIATDFEYWNYRLSTELLASTNALDTLSLEKEFDARSYISSLLNT